MNTKNAKRLAAQLAGAGFALMCLVGAPNAALIQGPAATLGGAAITFEGFAEGTLISNQFAGVTFSQDDLGTPMIDNFPFLFAYTASSGVGVLTGSTNGGAPFPTVAGLVLDFASAQSAVEFHLGDTAPLGIYTISAFGAGNVLLESFAVTPENFVGFTGLAGILRVTVDSNVLNDAFAIDDVRFVNGVPEPMSLGLVGIGLVGLALSRRRRR